MANSYLIQSRITQAMVSEDITRMTAIRRLTATALTEVDSVHRQAVDAARESLEQAETIQQYAGKSLDEPVFLQLTAVYLTELTRITELAGADMLRVIDHALR